MGSDPNIPANIFTVTQTNNIVDVRIIPPPFSGSVTGNTISLNGQTGTLSNGVITWLYGEAWRLQASYFSVFVSAPRDGRVGWGLVGG